MIAFAIAALLLIMVPGPDQALITRNALVGGRRAGLLTMLGGVLGVTVHATAAGVGLSALLLASSKAFTVLKLVGAAYLLWLGLQMLRSAVRSKRDGAADDVPAAVTRGSAYLRQGFLSNALNPKVALFFVAFLPQFLDPGRGPVAMQIIVLGLIMATIGMLSDVAYALAAGSLGTWLNTRPTFFRRQRYLTGSIYLALGVVAAITGRPATSH